MESYLESLSIVLLVFLYYSGLFLPLPALYIVSAIDDFLCHMTDVLYVLATMIAFVVYLGNEGMFCGDSTMLRMMSCTNCE